MRGETHVQATSNQLTIVLPNETWVMTIPGGDVSRNTGTEWQCDVVDGGAVHMNMTIPLHNPATVTLGAAVGSGTLNDVGSNCATRLLTVPDADSTRTY